LLRAGIDVGGTFTDLILYNERNREIEINKIPTNTLKPWSTVAAGIKNNTSDPSRIKEIRHGTTLGVNTIIERKGPRVGLLTTCGFRDLLEIGRQKRPRLYDLRAVRAGPLAARGMRMTVRERVAASGAVIKEPETSDIKAAISDFKEKKADAVAILFINSYANNINEKKAFSLMKRQMQDVYFSISSDIIPEFREYERLSTTVLNAYLGPVIKKYIKKLQREMYENSINPLFYICQSDGGITSAKSTMYYPARTLFSGPAAGVMGAAALFGEKYDNLITLDMGGTSTDISLILNHVPVTTTDKEIDGFPLRFPTIDVNTVGAGGGSIASIDEGGFLKVGPESAGAYPGPACYGKGGKEPTLTDANLILGLLDSELLLGGKIKLDIDKSRSAIKKSISTPLEMSLEGGAASIIKIITSNISENIKKITASAGLSPKEMKLAAFGGAGPMHAAYIAKELGISEVIIPDNPGVFSAAGLFSSNLTMDFVRTVRDKGKIKSFLKEIEKRGSLWFERENIRKEHRNSLWSMDIRYYGQNYEINIPVEKKDLAGGSFKKIEDSFHKKHMETYGHRHTDKKIEIVNLRLRCTGLISIDLKSAIYHSEGRGCATSQKTRKVFFPDRKSPLITGIYNKMRFPALKEIEGPAILEEIDSTIVIPPGNTAKIDGSGNVIIKSGKR
jgi:N-methylhydantoinase A